MLERRINPTHLRAEQEGDTLRIGGYAARFNELSVLLWNEFRENIAPGAFARSLDGGDIRALWNHDSNIVLGRTTNGSLRLWEDEQGLAFELELPPTQAARDCYELIRRGDVNQMSFGFTLRPDGDQWEYDENEQLIRTLLAVDLMEISPVTFPAYPTTSVDVRSAWGDRPAIPNLRRAAQDNDAAERARARLAAVVDLDLLLATRGG